MHHDAPHLKRIWNSFTQHIALLKIHFEVVRNNSFYVATVLMLSCNNSNPRSFCPSCASMRWFSASVKAFATSRNRWYIKTLASISMNLTSGSHFGFKKCTSRRQVCWKPSCSKQKWSEKSHNISLGMQPGCHRKHHTKWGIVLRCHLNLWPMRCHCGSWWTSSSLHTTYLHHWCIIITSKCPWARHHWEKCNTFC